MATYVRKLINLCLGKKTWIKLDYEFINDSIYLFGIYRWLFSDIKLLNILYPNLETLTIRDIVLTVGDMDNIVSHLSLDDETKIWNICIQKIDETEWNKYDVFELYKQQFNSIGWDIKIIESDYDFDGVEIVKQNVNYVGTRI